MKRPLISSSSSPRQAAISKGLALLLLTSSNALIDLSRHRLAPLQNARGCVAPSTTSSSVSAITDLPPADLVVTVNGSFQWVVNGSVNPTLTLDRGQTYLFDLAAFTDEHPFVINTHANDPFGPLLAGPAFGQVISFTPGPTMPATIYYHCVVHYGSMVGTIHLVGTQLPCIGDLNGDFVVNSFDFGIFASMFGDPCIGCAADLNGDGNLNSFDFGMFVNAFGNPCAP